MNKTKKNSLLLLLVSSAFILLSFVDPDKTAIRTVIDSISKPKIKKSLISFEKKGIEKSINGKDKLTVEELINTAHSFIGTRHCMGGTTKKCIDCSGLLWASFNELGVNLPHSSHEIARFGSIIPLVEDLKIGDLVFFYGTYSTNKLVTHSGIYLGDNQFIHTSSRNGVEISSLQFAYWKNHYLFATRVIE